MTPVRDASSTVVRWLWALWGLAFVTAPSLANAAGPEDDALTACVATIHADPSSPNGYYCLYGVARTQARHDEAIALLREILANEPDNPRAHDNLAALLDDTGQSGAELHYGAAIEGYAANGDHDVEVYTRMSFADHLSRRDPDASAAQLSRARTIAAELGDETLIAIADVQWARHLIRVGENLAEALRLVRRAEPIAMAQKYYQPKLVTLHTKRRLLMLLDEPAAAAEVLETIIAMNRQAGDHYVAAESLLTLAELLSNNTDLRSETTSSDPGALATEALELAREHGNPYAEAGARCLLGDLRQGNPEPHYEACRRHYAALDDPNGVGGALESLAILGVDSDPARAFDRLDQATNLLRERGVSRLQIPITRALLLWHVGRDAEAADATRAALDLVDSSFSRELNPLARAKLLGHWSSVYYVLADRQLGRAAAPDAAAIDAALGVVERMRTRVLIERLQAARDSHDELGPTAKAHRRTVETITELQRQLLESELSAKAREAMVGELEQAERDESALSDALVAEAHTELGLHREAAPSVATLQAALAPDQAILSYHMATSLPRAAPDPWPVRSSLFVITRDTATAIEVPDRRQIEATVDLFAGLFEARDGSEVAPAVGLYRDLVGAAIDTLPDEVTRLVIVPDGPLHRLPFAALRAAETSPPLVDRFAITLTPSLRLWMRLRALAGPSRSAAVVFADPELPRLDPEAAPERAWALSLAEGLGPLPHARAEAHAVAARLGPETELHIGARATEADVKRVAVDGFAVVHFASHALIDDANPQRAAIVLAPGSATEDGLLQTREIAQLQLPGAVVVLASCRSGSGIVVGGEGPIGLARAFFLAGARSVVASLWRVRDDDSQAFFAAFYRHLDAGMSVAQSVAAAQNDQRAAGAPAAAWAGFVVLGDGDVSPMPPQSPPLRWGWLALAAMVAGLAGWMVVGRRVSARR